VAGALAASAAAADMPAAVAAMVAVDTAKPENRTGNSGK
jgi:hypothetical protein